MRELVYYGVMLGLGFAWYKFGQKMLREDRYDKDGELNKGFLGPVGFLMSGGATCFLLFALLRALARGEISCIGKGCKGQVYTLAAHSADYWSNVFYLAWLVIAIAYAMYVTLKIWLRD